MRALIIVDVQNDFIPPGALGVRGGADVIPICNALQDKFDLVIGTRDWHPADHGSFASMHGKDPGEVIDLHGLPQVLWPDHCIQERWGAEFHADLKTDKFARVIDKGIDPRLDSYGAFFDNDWRRATNLETFLKESGVNAIYVAGLTADYCVKYTALDGIKLGFEVYVVTDSTRPVELHPGDYQKALDEMVGAGVKLTTSTEIQ